ncbi:MAG: ribosome maturation factor RimP [bacterium]|nr:ribosome maturation factor RimP [bacterium]
MSQTAFDAKLEAEFAAVAASSGCELVHVDVRPGQLRVFLDRPQGVTIDDCQTVSKQISALLDVADFGKVAYTLEVSSPGLDRELYGPRDYERFRGHLARVTFFGGPERAKKTIVGRLEEYRSGADAGGEISVTESDTGATHEIPLGDVEKARLEIEL